MIIGHFFKIYSNLFTKVLHGYIFVESIPALSSTFFDCVICIQVTVLASSIADVNFYRCLKRVLITRPKYYPMYAALFSTNLIFN